MAEGAVCVCSARLATCLSAVGRVSYSFKAKWPAYLRPRNVAIPSTQACDSECWTKAVNVDRVSAVRGKCSKRGSEPGKIGAELEQKVEGARLKFRIRPQPLSHVLATLPPLSFYLSLP